MATRKGKKYNLFSTRLTKSDEVAVLAVLRSGVLARGPQVAALEKDFARYVGARYAVAVSSGTAGLHLAVRALGWRAGDQILTSPFTFIASSNCLLYEGLRPVYIDIDPETLNLDFKSAGRLMTKKVKGIILPHIFGVTSPLAEFRAFQKKYHLPVIEDACESIARPDREIPIGQFGPLRVYSFFQNKIISAGEGGMVVTDNKVLADKVRAMSRQGFIDSPRWLEKIELGYNYRLTEIQASLAASQLRRLDKKIAKRSSLAAVYNKELGQVRELQVPKQIKRSWFVYCLLVKDPVLRDHLVRSLSARGIETSSRYFIPLYCFAHLKDYAPTWSRRSWPVTEATAARILALPLHEDLSKADIRFISRLIKEIISKWQQS